MGRLRQFVRKLRKSQALAAACLSLLFLSTTFVVAPTAASSAQTAVSDQRDELRLPEGYVFPRKGTLIQTALAPIPNRPNDLGGFSEKSAERSCVFVAVAIRSFAADFGFASRETTGAHFWTWTSRAPPAVNA